VPFTVRVWAITAHPLMQKRMISNVSFFMCVFF
jgi:hypothetical protein